MRLHALMECSLVNGPGRRAVIWLQGCSLHCPSCWNIATHSRDSGTRTISAELVSRVLEARSRYGIDGITLSGGEPVHQIDSVIKLLVFANYFVYFAEADFRESLFAERFYNRLSLRFF